MSPAKAMCRFLAELHNPDYDFPDALISLGADIFLGILEQAGKMQRP
ncbi:MAG: hypothetical protein IH927_07995 [Proteobacteria bacterium]|nr:hypothetical protein [Pseudomonadota bacterium]